MDEGEARRQELYGLLGDLPERWREIGAEIIGEEEAAGYALERLTLDLNGMEAVPAYFARPKGAEGPRPTVLYNHAHGYDYALGKDELTRGRDVMQRPPYADVLTGLGFNALCIDAWGFGERQGRSEEELVRETLWRGQTLWGLMVYDSIRALDYLASRPDVDAARVGTLGLSMGSTMAWWLAALDERVKVCIDLCCLSDFEALIAHRSLEGHGLYYFVPGLLKHFTSAQINALIAPRAHLSLAGIYDPLTPPDGLDRIDGELREVYAGTGAPEAWRMSRHATGHMETAAMRAEVVGFLREWL